MITRSEKADAVSLSKASTGARLTLGYLGIMLMIAGFIMLLPLLVLPFYPEESPMAYCFIFPSIVVVLAGYLMTLPIKGKEWGRLARGQDSAIITFTWILSIAACSFPFILTVDYSLTQAVFEATSGLSTTGLSVVDVTTCPHVFLLYRSILLFFGGIGLVLVMVSAISDAHGMRLYNAEGHTDRLLPNLRKSARVIVGIYSGYIILGTIALAVAGMPIFDAFNHAVAALSTGGFSTQSASIGAYDSVAIEIIIIVLMLLGATSFLLHLQLLRRDFRAIVHHSETKSLFCMTLGFSLLVGMVLFCSNDGGSFLHSLRIACFQAVSAITGTGFQTVSSFTGFPAAASLLLVLCMVAGGQIGSTSGGVKQFRLVIFFKSIIWQVRDLCSNHNNVHCDKVERYGTFFYVTGDDIRKAVLFIGFYLAVLLIGTLIFTFFGFSLEDAVFEFASALGAVGLSAGITGALAHPMLLWTATAGMLLGRLEIYPVIIGIWYLIRKMAR